MYTITSVSESIFVKLGSEISAFANMKDIYNEMLSYNLSEYKHFTFDISDAGYIDSSMLGQLLKINSKCKEFNINYNVVCSEEQSKIIQLCSLHKTLSIIVKEVGL